MRKYFILHIPHIQLGNLLLKKEARVKTRIYGIIIAVLMFSLILIVAAFVALNANAFVQPQESDLQPEATAIPSQASDNNTNNLRVNSQNGSESEPNPQNSSLITKEAAISIAMPYINQYAAENNRTVSKISARFVDTPFWEGASWSNRSRWDIFGAFVKLSGRNIPPFGSDVTPDPNPNPQIWIDGYQVVIWADNGRIDYQQAFAVL